MKQEDLLTLYGYNYWVNALILKTATQLTPEQYAAPAKVSHGSLRGTLVHCFGGELVWRLRCQEGTSPPSLPGEDEIPSFDSLVQRWKEEEANMRAFLASLRDADLTKIVSYTTTEGNSYENTLWHLLLHVVNHGTQHRAEAAIILTDYGFSPGDIDLVLFLRQQRA
jgi:uncharacterized damage-inducible protein DinB